MNRQSAVWIATAGLAAGCATSTSPPPKAAALPGTAACVLRADLRGWTVPDAANMVIESAGGTTYLIRLLYQAPDLLTREQLAFEDGDRNSQICSNGDYLLVGGPMPERVPIIAVRALSADEIKQLRAPKKPAS